ncbi:MAG: secretion protein HylD [Rhodospirillaceae bacterium]|nr:MAG: secretion protein HylD [Rhodospirillaceae bacterium]
MAKKPVLEIKQQTHMFLVVLIAMILAFFGWTLVGRLDVVSFAVGEVVPSSQVKTVQHFEGGIVAEIPVREGDRVKAGQALMVLESTASGADVDELNVRILALTADVARLTADVEGAETITFPDGFAKNHPQLTVQVQDLFSSRRLQLINDLNVQKALVNQRKREGDEISARLTNTREKLKLINEQVKISEGLLEDELTNRMLHLNLLKEVANLRGARSQDTAALARLQAAIEQETLSLEAVDGRFRVEARQDLDEKRRSLQELTNRSRKFADSLNRSVVVSPVDGVVMTLHVVTRGGVIQPGGKIADIVPIGDALVVEAKLPPNDVGYVHIGQTARVTLASSDSARFSPLEGEVIHISPDTVEGPDGATYYKVRIKTTSDVFESKGEIYRLVPGVQVMCSIVTGSRSVMEYIASPFMGSLETALQER